MTRRLVGVFLAALLAACQPVEPVSVSEARIKTPLPGMDKTVAYFRIENRSATDLELIGAQIGGVRAVEIHRSFERDGMMRMRRLDSVTIGAGETVSFQPGGLHLMVFGVEPLEAPRKLSLQFASGETINASLTELSPLDG